LVRLASSPAQEIADALLDATTTHAGAGGEPQDDRTVVVLKGRPDLTRRGVRRQSPPGPWPDYPESMENRAFR